MGGDAVTRVKLNDRFADAVWSTLCVHAGAFDDDRNAFVHSVTTSGLTEYRFCGSLGFGGKVRWCDWHGETIGCPIYVDCYLEDLTPERQDAIDSTNRALARVWDAWKSMDDGEAVTL